MMEINQQAGPQTSRPSPKVPTPIRKAPTPVTNIMKNAPSTVEYSIPRGPNRKVRMKATPTDFWPPTATTVELLTTVDGWEGVAAGGGVGATLPVHHSVPSHQRCPGWEGSAYHPGALRGMGVTCVCSCDGYDQELYSEFPGFGYWTDMIDLTVSTEILRICWELFCLPNHSS
jgi:hypothetical protein